MLIKKAFEFIYCRGRFEGSNNYIFLACNSNAYTNLSEFMYKFLKFFLDLPHPLVNISILEINFYKLASFTEVGSVISFKIFGVSITFPKIS